MFGKGDQSGEERRGWPCTEKPLAHTLIPVTMFSVAEHIKCHLRCRFHPSGQNCPAYWAFLPLIVCVPSLASPADLKETY